MVDTIIKSKANPHPGQRLVHESEARFKVLAAGRRWGKTRLGVMECLDVASKGGYAWWVSPTYKVSGAGWKPLVKYALDTGLEVRRVDRQIVFPNGGIVEVRSADKPGSLRGEGLDFVVVDEAAQVNEMSWFAELRPALTDKLGRALFIGTPTGHNWFHQLWLRGKKGDTGWESWQFPSVDNPYLTSEEVAAAKREIPNWIFEQEYLAVFISDGTQVFRNLNNCLGAELKDHRQGSYTYYFGVDLARVNDFTAISVLERKPNGEINQVYLDRFNQISYMFQFERLKVLNDKFRPRLIVVEENNIGDLFIEMCEKARLPVQRFRTTNQSKKELIERLSIGFERNQLRLLNNEVQLEELRAFGVEQLPSGRIRYAASTGHDDTIIALALSFYAACGGAGRTGRVRIKLPSRRYRR